MGRMAHGLAGQLQPAGVAAWPVRWNDQWRTSNANSWHFGRSSFQGRAALLKTPTAGAREHIKVRVIELLAELEETVIRDGADAAVLARLYEARRDVWD